MTESIETGDIYFFYRPKVDSQQVKDAGDVQRFYLALLPDKSTHGRVFVVGKKRLPEIIKGASKPTEKEWMMNYLTGSHKEIREELKPLVYNTKTKGEQEQGEAIPAGEGRYVLFDKKSSTRLAYQLFRPEKPGKSQRELGIIPEASFVISVRNPKVEVPGFPDEEPDYPKSLLEKFADKRWIDIDEPKLLDYENAQLLLIGAHDTLEEAEVKISGKPDLFKKLGLMPEEWPSEALEKGQLTEPKFEAEAKEPRSDRSKGGEHGGRAALKTASAAGVAKALKGASFPLNKNQLIDYAKAHQAPTEVLEVLDEMPSQKFSGIVDVQKALGEIR